MQFSDKYTLLPPGMNSDLPFVVFAESPLHTNAASKISAVSFLLQTSPPMTKFQACR